MQFRQQRVAIIQNQISQLRSVVTIFSGLIDAPERELKHDQIGGKIVDEFLKSVSDFLKFSYLYPKEYEDKIKSLSDQLSDFIVRSKAKQHIDEESAMVAVNNISVIRKEILNVSNARLRKLQSELDKMIDI